MARPRLTPEQIASRERTGRAIAAARQANGLRTVDLAAAVGISRPYMANLEAGRVRLTDEVADKLAGALRVRKAALVDPDEDVAA